MKLPRPNLDDRNAYEIIEDAKRHVHEMSTTWTDLSPSDPGVTLLELFGYVSEQVRYRLNRMPESHYVALLELIGVRLLPPSAAMVEVTVERPPKGAAGGDDSAPPVPPAGSLPRGSVVRSDVGGDPISFTTARDVELSSDQSQWTVRAYNASLRPPHVVWKGNGQPGLRVQLGTQDFPVVAPLRDLLSFRLWVEEPVGSEGSLTVDGAPFSTWREVEAFADTGPDDRVYRLDRVNGVIEFAPAVRRREVAAVSARLDFNLAPTQPFVLSEVETSPGEPRKLELRVLDASLKLTNSTKLELGEGIRAVSFTKGDTNKIGTAEIELDAGVRSGWRNATLSKGAKSWTSEASLQVLPPLLEGRPVPRGRVPGVGHRILVECWVGGGARGNVGYGTITAFATPPEFPLTLTNPRPSTGGRDTETLANALIRGPQELKELRRVVTASDYEAVVRRTSGTVARASALPKKERWAHAEPGTVQVVLVPDVPVDQRGERGWVRRKDLEDRSGGDESGTDLERMRILRALDRRRPLGTRCEVQWCRYKDVRVRARLELHPGVDAERVRNEIQEELHRLVSPLSWPFGRPLLVSDVYEAMLRNQGVDFVRDTALQVELDMGPVAAINPDYHQPSTYFSAAEGGVYRSLNEGQSWEQVLAVEGKVGRWVASSRVTPGLVVAIVDRKNEQLEAWSSVWISEDCGESWTRRIEEEAWEAANALLLDRAVDDTLLVIAADTGLLELKIQEDKPSVPVWQQIPPSTGDPDRPSDPLKVADITVGVNESGRTSFYMALEKAVLVSRESEFDRKFTSWPSPDPSNIISAIALEDRRSDGKPPRLWLGFQAAGARYGALAYTELIADQLPEWHMIRNLVEAGLSGSSRDWNVGSASQLLHRGDRLYVATHQGGVGVIDTSNVGEAMTLAIASGGLPVRGSDGRFFEPVVSLTALADGGLAAGGKVGLYASPDGLRNWTCRSLPEVDVVDMPPGYLPVSGDHSVTLRAAKVERDQSDGR